MEKCCICEGKENLLRVHTSKITLNPKVFYDGEIVVCKNCIENLPKCKKCNGIIDSIKDKLGISDFRVDYFCNCKINELTKKEEDKFFEDEKNRQENKNKLDFEKAEKLENSVNKITVEELDDFVFTNPNRIIIDDGLARVFRITTNQLREITKSNIKFFKSNEVYQLDDNELQNLKNDDSNYVTTINPYLYNINGVIKISALIDTQIAKDFIECFIKNALIGELLNIDNELLQKLYNSLTNEYYYNQIKKDKIEKDEKIKSLKNENAKLDLELDECKQKVLTWSFVSAIMFCIILGVGVLFYLR